MGLADSGGLLAMYLDLDYGASFGLHNGLAVVVSDQAGYPRQSSALSQHRCLWQKMG